MVTLPEDLCYIYSFHPKFIILMFMFPGSFDANIILLTFMFIFSTPHSTTNFLSLSLTYICVHGENLFITTVQASSKFASFYHTFQYDIQLDAHPPKSNT